MAAIIWDAAGEHFYENGVDHVVLYPYNASNTAKPYSPGVAWNGVTSISESPSGADPNKQWADNINYLTIYGAEEYGATIEAFTYPDEFEACDGSAQLIDGVPGITVGQQPRQGFGYAYRTKIGNDTVGQNLAFKLHLVYGARAAPSDRSYETINDSPEAITFSWEISTTPVAIPGHEPSATLTFDSRELSSAQLKLLTDKLYGTESGEPYLPLPQEIYTMFGGTTGTTGVTG